MGVKMVTRAGWTDARQVFQRSLRTFPKPFWENLPAPPVKVFVLVPVAGKSPVEFHRVGKIPTKFARINHFWMLK